MRRSMGASRVRAQQGTAARARPKGWYSGPEALALAHSFKPDVNLSDIGLPGMDGYDVAKEMRADPDPELRATFLVALSGYAQPEDLQRSKQAGFDRHLSKPASLEAIEQVLAEAPRHESRA